MSGVRRIERYEIPILQLRRHLSICHWLRCGQFVGGARFSLLWPSRISPRTRRRRRHDGCVYRQRRCALVYASCQRPQALRCGIFLSVAARFLVLGDLSDRAWPICLNKSGACVKSTDTKFGNDSIFAFTVYGHS
jgi:hypothetical protein